MSRGEFDPKTHSYSIDGRPVPGVTSVLRDLLPGWTASDWHLQRGRAVHACVAMIARGQTFIHDPQIEGQVQAAERFFRETRPQVLKVEYPVYSRQYQYAGTLDLVALLAGHTRRVLIDFKASLTETVPYQCAGYGVALREQDPALGVSYGIGVELRADGTYRMSDTYTLKHYGPRWLALLTAYKIRRECGVKEETEEQDIVEVEL